MDASTHLLLTGGTGFFGRSLLRHWMVLPEDERPAARITVLSRNPQVFSTRFPDLARLPWLQWSQGDIANPDSLPHQFRFTHLIHAAADSTLGPQLVPLDRFDQILQGTRNVLDLAVRCKAWRFLLTSSGAVYGAQPLHLDRLPEDWHGMPDPLNAAHAYGVAKRAAEHLCSLYSAAFGLHTVIARCFAFVGPDLPLSAHFAIGNFIRDALWSEDITVSGDGTPLRSFLDQADLARWLTTLLLRGPFGQAFNVGSDHALSIAEVARLVRDSLAPDKRVQLLGEPLANGGRHIYVPDISKAQNALGLRVDISLKDSIIAAAAAAAAQRRGPSAC